MIRALRGDNIDEPVEQPKAESRMARVQLSENRYYELVVCGIVLDVQESSVALMSIANGINAEVDRRCREAVRERTGSQLGDNVYSYAVQLCESGRYNVDVVGYGNDGTPQTRTQLEFQIPERTEALSFRLDARRGRR